MVVVGVAVVGFSALRACLRPLCHLQPLSQCMPCPATRGPALSCQWLGPSKRMLTIGDTNCLHVHSTSPLTGAHAASRAFVQPRSLQQFISCTSSRPAAPRRTHHHATWLLQPQLQRAKEQVHAHVDHRAVLAREVVDVVQRMALPVPRVGFQLEAMYMLRDVKRAAELAYSRIHEHDAAERAQRRFRACMATQELRKYTPPRRGNLCAQAASWSSATSPGARGASAPLGLNRRHCSGCCRHESWRVGRAASSASLIQVRASVPLIAT